MANIVLKKSVYTDIIINGANTLIKHRGNGNRILYEGRDIITLLDLFSTPSNVNEVIDNRLAGDAETYFKQIIKLAQWGFLVPVVTLLRQNCPICNSSSLDHILTNNNPEFEETFEIERCTPCNFIFVNPTPNISSMKGLYTFFNKYSKYATYESAHIPERLNNRSNAKRVLYLRRFIDIRKEIKLLDVGCSTGEFIAYMAKKFNLLVTGIDIDPIAVSEVIAKNRDIDAIASEFVEYDFMDRKFDVITMWGFLEHEFDPVTILKKAHKLLEDQGLIFIETPNIDTLFAKLAFANWPYLNPPYHLSYYSVDALKKLCKITGFKVKSIIYDKTGPFLLKYSDTILFLLKLTNIRYASLNTDRIIQTISYPFILLEKIFGIQSRIILIASKC